jgi:hypothetical protein
MKRICSGVPGKPCGLITDKNRCPDCARKYEIHRGPRTMKGRYDAQWRKLVAQAKREHPWCSVCKHPGSPDNPLTGDHITPHRAGGRNVRSNVQVLCRRHNSSKGGRLENKGVGDKSGAGVEMTPPRQICPPYDLHRSATCTARAHWAGSCNWRSNGGGCGDD